MNPSGATDTSYLRGNYRKKAMDEDYTAVGGGFANWIQGSNVNPDFRFGGMLMASYTGSVSGVGVISYSAMDMLTSAYGITAISNLNLQIGGGSVGSTSTGIGFKIIPFAFNDFSGDGASHAIFYTLSSSNALTGDDSIVAITPKIFTISGPVTSASVISVHFWMMGLIVSVPSGLK